MKCRVRPHASLPHAGSVLAAGTDVDLDPAIAMEVRHLVLEVLPDGSTRQIGADDAAAAELERQLATARPHERISLLEAARAQAATALDILDAQIAAERKRIADEAKTVAKAVAKDKPAEAPKA